MTFISRHLMCFKIVFAAILVTNPGVCFALMADPEDRFSRPSNDVFAEIAALKKLSLFLSAPNASIEFRSFPFEEKEVSIVRVCDDPSSDYCNTAFFMDGISDENFFGIAYLPKLTTWGNTWRRDCGSCPRYQPLIFVDSKGNWKGVWRSKFGVIF